MLVRESAAKPPVGPAVGNKMPGHERRANHYHPFFSILLSEVAPVTAEKEVSRRRGPDPLVAAALSAVWPGLGHFGHSNRRAILLIITTLAATVAGLAYAVTLSKTTLLTWSVTRSSLLILIAGILGVLAFRAAVTTDAYRIAVRRYHPRRTSASHRVGTFATLVLVAAIIVAPHAIAIRFAVAQLALLSSVFDATDTQTAVPTPLPTTSPATPATNTQTTTPTPLPTTNPATPATNTQTTTPTPLPTTNPATPATNTQTTTPTPPPATSPATPAPVAPVETPPSSVTVPQTTAAPSTAPPSTTPPPPTWDGADRLTIALLGSDAGFDRSGVRTDTIILLSIDMASGDAAAFNVPRNWKHLTFPEGTPAAERWPDGYPRIANEVYGLGLRYPEAFPGVEDRAGHAIKSALAQLTGLDIQYYVLLDMQGFVATIDLFGGIDIHVTETINDRIKPIVPEGPPIDIVVEPGDHHFDGLTALGYVRSRSGSSDYHRMTRQRCAVAALIDQVTPAEVLANYLPLTGIISDHITTDIPLDRLDELIVLAERLDTSRIVTVNFIPPEFPRGPAPVAKVREAVTRALQGTADKTNRFLANACREPS